MIGEDACLFSPEWEWDGISLAINYFSNPWKTPCTTIRETAVPTPTLIELCGAVCSVIRSRCTSATGGEGNWMHGADFPAMTAHPARTDPIGILPETVRGASHELGINRGAGPLRPFFISPPAAASGRGSVL